MLPWILIGCGYVGTALARRLVAEGQDVVVTRRDAADARALATELGTRGRAVDLAGVLEPAPRGAIVVCLAPPGPEPAREIANLATATAGARLIYVSSTAVYSPGGGAWVDELWPLAPVTAAGRARLAAETALPATAIALRVAGIYGPGRGLVERLRTGTYRIVGDGSSHISRIHVDDLVEAIVRAGASTVSGAVNISDDDPGQIGELADAVAARLGVAKPRRVPASSVDPDVAAMLAADRRIANTRMKRELGVVLRYPSVR